MSNSKTSALLLDLSGVLYEGQNTVPGAIEAVDWARQAGLTLRFVTNTATDTPATILNRLSGMGFDVHETELFTAPMAAKAYIREKRLRPYCLLHPALMDDFSELGDRDPNCVVLGDAREALNYDNLNAAFRVCMEGATLIGIGMNKFFKDDEGLKLDAGPFIRALEWAADTEAVIMGKPSQDFFDQVVASTGFNPSDCLMIGDDLKGDVEGAIHAGLQACLVRTGKFQDDDANHLPADAGIIDSIDALQDWMNGT